jgi:hypothetical protein
MELILHSMSLLSLVSTITSGNAEAVIEHKIYHKTKINFCSILVYDVFVIDKAIG